MRLHDTRRGAIVPFAAPHTVRVYVCGITPYDSTHLGHAFTYVSFDVLVRYLEARGHRVRYVRNVTDVDDDILRKARELGVASSDLARGEMARFSADLSALGLRAPDVEPWASAAVPAMRTTIAGLLAGGFAYTLPDGRVYFDTTASGRPPGSFAGIDRAEALRQFAEKGGDPEADGKRDALDFLLWQPSAAGEPRWDSPWGAGRPGWHIECSVMAMEELGPVIDIHGGGNDLVFPHHEAENLQAECLTGQAPFARVWLHTGMVARDGVKMSKSLGNLVFVDDLLHTHSPAAVRRYLISHHYRASWSHDPSALEAAEQAVAHWRAAVTGRGTDPDLAAAFDAALAADLDTPGALAVLDEAARSGAGATLRAGAATLGFTL